MTPRDPDILCIGSVLWDVIGRCTDPMVSGNDKPGRITRIPGGVALNIAMTLAGLGFHPALLSVVGEDAEGAELSLACARLGLDITHLTRAKDLPTDRYMAIEASNGLVAAIADAHSLEAAGDRILSPLINGPLGTPDAPFQGPIALDGNLTEGLLAEIAEHPAFALADLRIAPASPGKATRLLPFLSAGRGTLYVNLEEACLLCEAPLTSAPEAAAALVARGAARALVTNGGAPCGDAIRDGVVTETPRPVTVTRVTGAGDTFMAAHIAAERDGLDRQAALRQALAVAADYVSGGDCT
ncbi:PfkB family carbohydrate kinase [Mameliella sediminis]|uniref:PfkB family carbohydrate kinase n=1 Tax=Mameliella sediminis TaxID=2836866 RepID=UPI001C45D2A5|nr:PfkB family carbohydrate kinase [Mameliella sediminis]MBY6115760.1 kinase [Antarctobacter heliothermus]MBY6146007.1 kinase [Mameliella alba]MBV7393272.1 kinase [Mameliella sediminis]MBY6161329.1 kinase [Mameliella alba]MBY6169799.1 kinase [Mameliella alba]